MDFLDRFAGALDRLGSRRGNHVAAFQAGLGGRTVLRGRSINRIASVASFFLSIILTLLGWIPGVIHACLVVNDYHAEKRAAAAAH